MRPYSQIEKEYKRHILRNFIRGLHHFGKSIMSKMDKINTSSSENVRNSKSHFCDNFGIPGVIGCIDGTHVKFMKPCQNEHLYFNRKGCFSINAMIICDYKMAIRAVDACHPGSCHDSFVFNLSSAKQLLLSKYESGDRNSCLLGDSGYGLDTFLLVPYRDPRAGTPQHKFNMQHSKARNIVERVLQCSKAVSNDCKLFCHMRPRKLLK
ncbi:PREDICTED: putative nuclease HARBI1 [Rhagoletis zephyria]|uniref:putative nuclease HARBI1 n=1 Tax=Rhagoletis zephyria TaxID=28612 RepID=UPI0008116977|nr:PREDICTED: putative nuclease HARBI1 [Rhagoletis zephyria]XP_017470020.1 PREDICTED: putative nuclease HARBI1 [Rhagoletis zephyria]XP_036345223.1 putative nuclease HARBI1 [Rhagoletis pomonella]